MPRSRRLRRLVPDDALLERRVSGESLRVLAQDYGVAHTTLLRYFRRPEVVLELREARRRLPERRRAARAERAKERRMEKEVRKQAREDAKWDREVDSGTPPQPPRRFQYEGPRIEDWLDQRDAPPRGTSRDSYSANDRRAEKVVATGGGVGQVIEATGLRNRDNVYRNIDSQIVARALKNDARRGSQALPDTGALRRLVPDAMLLLRRADGEPLRELARDYGVSHTSLLRYFQRPQVAKKLLAATKRQAKARRSQPRVDRGRRRQEGMAPQDHDPRIVSEVTAAFRREIRKIVCPIHRRRPTLRPRPAPAGTVSFAVTFCCPVAQRTYERHFWDLERVQSAASRPDPPSPKG